MQNAVRAFLDFVFSWRPSTLVLAEYVSYVLLGWIALSPLGKLIVCGPMFAGRAGPQAFAAALFLPCRILRADANSDVAF